MRGAALLATAVTPFFAAVQPGQATKAGHEAKRCGILAKGSADYRIKARKVTCRFARKWSRAYLDLRSAAPRLRLLPAEHQRHLLLRERRQGLLGGTARRHRDSDPGGTPTRARDDSFSHRFTRPGTYTYFCRAHPDQMKGSVEVVELSGLGDTKRPCLTRVRVGPERRRIAFTLSERAILPLRGLAPGRCRVRLTAYDDADNASRPAFARLRI